MPRPEKSVGQRNALASERMSNAIPMFVFRVVQSTLSFFIIIIPLLCFHQFRHKFVRLTKFHFFSRGKSNTFSRENNKDD